MTQIEREKALAEIVLRFREPQKLQEGTVGNMPTLAGTAKATKRQEQQVASMASTLLRREILHWFKSSPSQDNKDDPWQKPLANFQTALGKLIRLLPEETVPPEDPTAPKRTGRPPGAKHSFRQIWINLGLGLDDKALHDEGALFFYLTLYTLLKNTIDKVGDKEITEAHLLLPDNCELLEDKEANEEEDVTDEEDLIQDDEMPNEPDLPPIQDYCSKVWEIIALELSFRPETDNTTKSGQNTRTRRSTIRPGAFFIAEEIARSFADKKGLDLKKRMEFAGTLIDVLINSYPVKWFEMVLVKKEDGNRSTRIKVILPTPELLKQIKQLSQETLTLSHQAPLIEPPIDWGQRGIRQGGYHYRHLPFYKFHQKNQKIIDFLTLVNRPAWYTEVFAATNALQRTPWRINQRVWQVVEGLYALAKVTLPTAANSTLFPTSELPKGKTALPVTEQLAQLTPKQRNAWRKWLRNEENFYARDRGRAKGPGARNAYRVTISTLLDALPRERIYFAHQIDTRGRLYPVGSILQPQGDDLNRALLEFADPLPLTASGIRPLAIYGSQQIKDKTILNYFQIRDRDKPTLEERYEWIAAHSEQIVRCAKAPLHETWWRGGEVANDPAVSKPFTFLAFCFAWADFQQHGEQVGCSLPVHVDGTCNGLQHIAALMRDEALARATNVLPDNVPRDIYSEVAQEVRQRMLHPITEKGTTVKNAEISDSPLTENGVIEFLAQFKEDLVDRALAKSVVMIIPYGAGQQNYQQNIYKQLSAKILPVKINKGDQSKDYADWIMDWLNQHPWAPTVTRTFKTDDPQKKRIQLIKDWIKEACAFHLAYHFNQAVHDHYPTIKLFKRRLTKSIKPLNERNIPAMWVSPSGLPVLQNAFRNDPKIKEVKADAITAIRFRLRQISNDVALSKQSSGILPNFIHSLDAAHLVKTLNLAQARNITHLSTVHDSYATHACHIDLLGDCIREAFCEIYPPDQDRLKNFEVWCDALLAKNPIRKNPPFTPAERALMSLARLWSQENYTKQGEKSASQSNTEQKPKPTNKDAETNTQSEHGYWTDHVKQSQYFFS